MGLFNKPQKTYDIKYRLHIVCILEDWNQMQQRDFVAVDIQARKFYRVHEELGASMASRFFIKAVDTEELKRLCGTAAKCTLINISEFDSDWASFVAALSNTEIAEITKEQLFPGIEI